MKFSRSKIISIVGCALALSLVGCASSGEQQVTDPTQPPPDSTLSQGCIDQLTQRPGAQAIATPRVVASNLLAPVDVTFRVTVPANTPTDAQLFIAGDFQGWNPGDPSYQLARQSASVFAITISVEDGSTIEFKFTRGSWETVEKGLQGEEIQNRRFLVAGPETADVTVASWADTAPAPPRTIVGNIDEMTVPSFLADRRVWVYLPPGYSSDVDKCYPVLYVLDGQNVFDSTTAFLGNEWNIDEALEGLIAAEMIEPVIVVAVDNGGASRIDEYTPWPDPDYGGGQGDAHLTAFIDTLVPYINDNFRTRMGPENTSISGSSLGGLMSLYAVYAFPETFGAAGALSPSLWWNDQNLRQFVDSGTKPDSSVIYMDMGTIESGSVVDEDNNGLDDNIDHIRALRDVLTGQGFVVDDDLLVVEEEGGMHNEAAWSRRFPGTLQFLFPAQ